MDTHSEVTFPVLFICGTWRASSRPYVVRRNIACYRWHRAAEVAGRGDAEAGDAGGEIGAAEILGDQRTADGEAVIVVGRPLKKYSMRSL